MKNNVEQLVSTEKLKMQEELNAVIITCKNEVIEKSIESEKRVWNFECRKPWQRNIIVQIQSKINGNEEILDPKIIIGEKREAVLNIENPELLDKSQEDDPAIEIPIDLSCWKRKISEEEMEEAVCRGELWIT
jgi:hypothetical protein